MRYKLQLINLSTDSINGEWVMKLPAVVGRSPDADVPIGNPSISRQHCEFFLNGDGALCVRDCDSMNGTFVNGRKVAKTTLPPDAVVKIGEISLKVEWTDDDVTQKRQYGRTGVNVTQPMKTLSKDDLNKR